MYSPHDAATEAPEPFAIGRYEYIGDGYYKRIDELKHCAICGEKKEASEFSIDTLVCNSCIEKGE